MITTFIRCVYLTGGFFLVNFSNAQNAKVDSLRKLLGEKSVLHTYTGDTTTAGLYYMIGEQFVNNKPDSALYYYTKAQQKAVSLKDNNRNAQALNRIGLCWHRKSNYDTALYYFESSLNLSKVYSGKNYNNCALVYYKKGDQVKASMYVDKGLAEHKKNKNQTGLAESNYIKGLIETELGNYTSAMRLFEESLDISEKIKDPIGIASALYGASMIYNYNGNFTKAFENLFKALNLYEVNGQKFGMSSSYSSIGLIYMKLSEFDKAKSYFEKALNISRNINSKAGIVVNYGNLGFVLDSKNELDSALYYYDKTLVMETELGNNIGIARQLSNIGGIYLRIGKYEEALNKLLLAVDLNKKMANKSYLKVNYAFIAEVYLRKKQYGLSETYLQQSIDICNELKSYHGLKNAYGVAIELYKTTGDYKKAFSAYEKYIAARDTILSKNNEKASVQKEMQYEFDKKMFADSIKALEEKKVVALRNKQERTQRYALYGGLIFILIFTGFIFNRYRASQKQKRVIEQQKHLVEEKQKEILDSIRYAKRIQMSLLASEKYIHKSIQKLASGKKE